MAELKLLDVSALIAPARIRTIVKAPLAPVQRLASPKSSRRVDKTDRRKS